MYIIGYHLTNHILEKNRLVRGSEDVLKFTSMLLILISVISFNESDCSVFDWTRKNWDISDKLRSVASCDSEIKSTSMLVKVHIYWKYHHTPKLKFSDFIFCHFCRITRCCSLRPPASRLSLSFLYMETCARLLKSWGSK